jgi:hypothetical protein
VGLHEEVGEVLPAGWAVEVLGFVSGGTFLEKGGTYTVGICSSSWWKGQESACLLDFFRVCVFVRKQELFGVSYRGEEFGLVLCPYELNILLEPEHKLQITLSKKSAQPPPSYPYQQ